ncbi:hypothetical protein H6G65_09720 [Microcystis elabens FACHB-917]|nr:hypothetical protein [Microcystis elabens FACHB-917]
MPTPQEVLRFWFEETPPSAWFRAGPERDRTGRDRFWALTEQALGRPSSPEEEVFLQQPGSRF